MSESTAHYVVRVVVERVDRPAATGGTTAYHTAQQVTVVKPAGRVVTELANITVRADNLVNLVDKADAHLHLVEDIAATDPRAEVGKRA